MFEYIKPYRYYFREEIYGNKAIVYHRTEVSDLINRVYTSGYKPGSGSKYGKGFYATYDLDSQLESDMKDEYGNIIVRFMVNSLNRFFFFDYSEFLKSPVGKKLKSTKDTFIEDQLNHFKIPIPKNLDLEINSKYSSNIAEKLSDIIRKKVDGIVFTGSRDGKVLLAYNTKLIIPTSYSINEGRSFEKVSPKNMEYLKQVFSQDTFSPKEEEHWIDDADIDNAEYQIKKDGSLIWKNGEWISGEFKGGEFKGGTWKYGKFLDGIFENSIWKNGDWSGKLFKGNTWNNGIFRKGIFENGNWIDGIWAGGTWKNGKWKRGTIYDPDRKGNPDFIIEEEGIFVITKVSPKEYFGQEKSPY